MAVQGDPGRFGGRSIGPGYRIETVDGEPRRVYVNQSGKSWLVRIFAVHGGPILAIGEGLTEQAARQNVKAV